MSSFKKNKKIFLTAGLVIFLAGGIFVLSAPNAHAAWSLFGMATGAVYNIILSLLSVIQKFFGLFLSLAASLLEAAFQMGKFHDIPVVNSGWQITRGLCNMFLALILLIMAISTVLNIERFGWKKILPKLVIVALLINFSLLFAGIIIDFSQVMTSYFIDGAKGKNPVTGQEIGISAQIMNGLNIGKSLDAIPNPDAAAAEACTPRCVNGQICQLKEQADETGTVLMAGVCVDAPNTNLLPSAQIEKGDAGTLQVIVGYLFGIIMTAIATFTVMAAAILLIFRIVMLWLLLIFSPLAWVSWIVGTGGLWGKWWSTFFKWTFFAPIYAFFIYLAVLAVGSSSFSQAFMQAKGTGVLNGIFNSLAGSLQLTLQYIVIIIILLGGLIAAQSMGITGAGAIASWGKKAGKGMAKWTGKQATRPARYGLDQITPGATAAAGKVLSTFGFKKGGERLQAKATQMRESPKERKQHKDYANLIKSMSDKDLLNETKSAWGVRSLIAAREAKERGLLAKTTDRTAVKEAMSTFEKFGVKDEKGRTKEQKELEETRFDAIDNPEKRKDAIRRAKESGNLDKVNSAVFGKMGVGADGKPAFITDEVGKQVIKDMQKELKTPEFIETYKKWGKQTKAGADSAMASNFNPDSKFNDKTPEGEADMNNRKLYAATTGKIVNAFGAAADASKEIKDAADNAAREFIKNMKPGQVSDIFPDEDGKKSLELIGKHIAPQLLANVHDASIAQKEIIKNSAKINNNSAAIEYMNNSPAWGGKYNPKNAPANIEEEEQTQTRT